METLASDRILGGRYRLRRQIARGGMATVWEADDRILSRRVAIKILHPHLADDDGFRVRFRREAVAAARLAHPNIVTTYDTGRDSDFAYIVMELVEGTTLARLLRASGPLPINKAIDIAAQVADALACAHIAGIIHRDVKPANILVRQDGHVKVADFGIAKAGAGADLTRTGMVMGTAKYLSPEQVSGAPADASSDVFALGVVLYEMLCGVPPFLGETDLSTALCRLTSAPASLRDRRPEVPRPLEAVVLRALAREPQVRFRGAAEFRAGMLAADLDQTDSPTPPAGVATTLAPARRFPARAVTAAVAGALVLTSGLLLVDGGDSNGTSPTKPSPGRASPVSGVIRPAPPLAKSFDPAAGGGDGVESPDTVAHLTDGDPATVWHTDRYKTATFGGLKEGVGVYFDLGTAEVIDGVAVTASPSGWAGQVYVAERAFGDLSGWGEPLGHGSGTFRTGGAEGRYVLVWFTKLPPTDGGFRLDVSGVTIDTRT